MERSTFGKREREMIEEARTAMPYVGCYCGTRGPFRWTGEGGKLVGDTGMEVCQISDSPNGPASGSDEAKDTQRLLRGSFELLEFVRGLCGAPEDRIAEQARRVLKAIHLYD